MVIIGLKEESCEIGGKEASGDYKEGSDLSGDKKNPPFGGLVEQAANALLLAMWAGLARCFWTAGSTSTLSGKAFATGTHFFAG